jgi:hypothetical protein
MREKNFPAEKLRSIDEPPLLGPLTIERDGRAATVFRWLGHGRGADYVQAEVDDVDGSIVVHGGFGHAELGPFRPDVDLGLALVLDVWPPEAFPDGEPHLRFAVRSVAGAVIPSARVIAVLTVGTVYVRAPGGETIERDLGLWRGPQPPDLSPREIASHCFNGPVSDFIGSEAPGTYSLHWESSGLWSNDLVVERDPQGAWHVVPPP